MHKFYVIPGFAAADIKFWVLQYHADINNPKPPPFGQNFQPDQVKTNQSKMRMGLVWCLIIEANFSLFWLIILR
jgi:hypothetical protein